MSADDFNRDAFDCPFETVSSLRRIQTLYGAIAEAAGSDGSGFVGDEFRLYVTPGELGGFTTTESGADANSLVTVQVDLTDDSPSVDDVVVEPLREEMVPKLGFSRYPWGRGIDNSITRRGAKGGSNRDTMTTYCVDCLERWTNADGREPAVGEVAETHPDGWVIQALQALGERDDLEDTIREALKRQVDAETSPRVVATVAIDLNPAELEHTPIGDSEEDYYYPGQLHVLNAGMRARKELKLARKNLNDGDPPSRGDGTCQVTGEDTTVYGTAEDPLALFTVQHTEKFPHLKKPESWRSHPISSQAALLVQSGASLIEQCGTTRGGRSVYTIPYYAEVDAGSAHQLYHLIQDTDTDTQAAMAKLQRKAEAQDDYRTDLRFSIISLRNDSGDINVLHENPDATITAAREIADHHMGVLHSSTFDSVAGFARPSNWQPIDPNTTRDSVVDAIVSGDYAYGTVSYSDADDPPIDETTEWLTFALIGGESIPVNRLLKEYVDRLATQRQGDDENRLSENHLKAQYAQLLALAGANRLTAPEDNSNLIKTPHMHDTSLSDPELPPTDEFITDRGTIPLDPLREYRLNRFLKERPSFDDPQRLAGFLAGVLVGQLAAHQSGQRGMNRTVLAEHPPERMTGRRIERLVNDLIDKANVYAMESQHGDSLFPELEDRLPAALLDAAAAEWTLAQQDLRFHYALGQLYGKRAQSRAFDLRERIAAEAGIELDN